MNDADRAEGKWSHWPKLAGYAGLLLLTGCGDGSSQQSGGATILGSAVRTSAEAESLLVAPPVDVFVNPAADFVKSTPDTQVTVYVGWSPAAGANGYRIQYVLNNGTPAFQDVAAGQTGAQLPLQPVNGSLVVSVAAKNGTGQPGAYSSSVTTQLPYKPAPGSAEWARYVAADAYSRNRNGEYLLISKNGGLVYAGAPQNGYDPTKRHLLNSGTKSFSCALAAFAKQDYPVKMDMDRKMEALVTDWSSITKPYGYQNNDPNMTLRDFLTLQSGLAGNQDFSNTTDPSTVDTYGLAVNEKVNYPRGTAFIYDQLSFQNFALYFQIASGGTYLGNGQLDTNNPGLDPVDYLDTKLFGTNGFGLTRTLVDDPNSPGDYGWAVDQKEHPLMPFGATITPRAWMKYGQFMLQKGTWQSKRLLPAQSVGYCVGNALGTNGYINPALKAYGLSFWLNAPLDGSYDSSDQVPTSFSGSAQFGQTGPLWPSAPTDTFMAGGGGFQRLYVIPSQNLVVVRFGPSSNEDAPGSFSDDEFLNKLLN